jgi:hypothetical protein
LERPDEVPLGIQRLFESSYTITEARADAMLTSLRKKYLLVALSLKMKVKCGNRKIMQVKFKK